jgi:hypothetical protein
VRSSVHQNATQRNAALGIPLQNARVARILTVSSYGRLVIRVSLSLSLKVVSGIFISELPSDCHRGCRVSLFVVRDKDGTGSNIAFDKATRIARFKWSERNSKKLAAPCERHLILMLLRHLGGHFLHTNLKYVMHESGCCNRRFGFVMFSSQAREICRSTVSTTSVKEGPDTSLISMRSLVFTGRHCVLARSCLSDSRRFS